MNKITFSSTFMTKGRPTLHFYFHNSANITQTLDKPFRTTFNLPHSQLYCKNQRLNVLQNFSHSKKKALCLPVNFLRNRKTAFSSATSTSENFQAQYNTKSKNNISYTLSSSNTTTTFTTNRTHVNAQPDLPPSSIPNFTKLYTFTSTSTSTLSSNGKHSINPDSTINDSKSLVSKIHLYKHNEYPQLILFNDVGTFKVSLYLHGITPTNNLYPESSYSNINKENFNVNPESNFYGRIFDGKRRETPVLNPSDQTVDSQNSYSTFMLDNNIDAIVLGLGLIDFTKLQERISALRLSENFIHSNISNPHNKGNNKVEDLEINNTSFNKFDKYLHNEKYDPPASESYPRLNFCHSSYIPNSQTQASASYNSEDNTRRQTSVSNIPDYHFYRVLDHAYLSKTPIFLFGREHYSEMIGTFKSLAENPSEIFRLVKFLLKPKRSTSPETTQDPQSIDSIAPNFYKAFRIDSSKYLAHSICKFLLEGITNSHKREYSFSNKTLDDPSQEENITRRILLKTEEKAKEKIIALSPPILRSRNTGQPFTISVVTDSLTFIHLQSFIADELKHSSIGYHEDQLRKLEKTNLYDIFKVFSLFFLTPFLIFVWAFTSIISITRRIYFQGKSINVGGDRFVQEILPAHDIQPNGQVNEKLEKVNILLGLKNWYRDRSRD